MAKGQQRSGREAKKPKKAAAPKDVSSVMKGISASAAVINKKK